MWNYYYYVVMLVDKNVYKTEEVFYDYNLLYGTQNLIRAYSPKMHPLSSSVKVFFF